MLPFRFPETTVNGMRWMIGFVAVLAALFLFAYFQIDGGVMVPGQTVLENALQWVIHATGNGIAAVAAFMLLLRALQGEPVEAAVPLAISLLAGLLLADPQWSTTLALAAIAVSLIVREVFVRHAFREPRDPT